MNTVWAIGGGKGGIGKSFISSSIAICLTKLGKSVTIVDLDLGSANLHTCLGAKIPDRSISDFITGRVQTLQEVAAQTDIHGLQMISGFNDALNIADMPAVDKAKLIANLRTLKSQYVILDLGAGTTEHTLDFFLAADQKIIAVTPEPTSIENAYRFMKSAYYRELRSIESELHLQSLIESIMDSKNTLGIKSPADLVRYLSQSSPEIGRHLESRMAEFRFQIVLNQVRTRQDIELGHSIKSVCKKYFAIEANFLGYIDHDNAVWQSLRKRRPLLSEYPYSSIVGQFMNITKNLLNPEALRAVI